MASAFSSLVVLAFIVVFTPCLFAWFDDDECKAYTDLGGNYHKKQTCTIGFCCGSCYSRYCCDNSFMKLSESKQESCEYEHRPIVPMVLGIGGFIVISLIFVLCCVCPCCCLYKACRRPRPVVATTTHTTVVTSTPQTYPQQPRATPQPQPYQPAQYPAYQPIPVQPGYGAQPTLYQGAPYFPGPPPTYQEATGPPYPAAPMPYSQAAFTPGQASYPLQPPGLSPAQPQPQPQAQASAPRNDFLSQPAFNPDYVPNKM